MLFKPKRKQTIKSPEWRPKTCKNESIKRYSNSNQYNFSYKIMKVDPSEKISNLEKAYNMKNKSFRYNSIVKGDQRFINNKSIKKRTLSVSKREKSDKMKNYLISENNKSKQFPKGRHIKIKSKNFDDFNQFLENEFEQKIRSYCLIQSPENSKKNESLNKKNECNDLLNVDKREYQPYFETKNNQFEFSQDKLSTSKSVNPFKESVFSNDYLKKYLINFEERNVNYEEKKIIKRKKNKSCIFVNIIQRDIFKVDTKKSKSFDSNLLTSENQNDMLDKNSYRFKDFNKCSENKINKMINLDSNRENNWLTISSEKIQIHNNWKTNYLKCSNVAHLIEKDNLAKAKNIITKGEIIKNCHGYSNEKCFKSKKNLKLNSLLQYSMKK